MSALDLEVRRLLAHFERIEARKYLATPEAPTGFNGWPDFEDSRSDPVALLKRAVKEQS